MTEFRVHCGDPNVTYKATMEDQGLCYVSKFIVDDGPEIISYIKQEESNIAMRIETNKETLRAYGYEIIEENIK